MSPITLTLVLALVVMASASPSLQKKYYDVKDGPILFEQFMRDYERTYQDEADKQLHYEAFLKNLEKINKQNTRDSGATYGINKFADYTKEEMEQMHGFRKPS